MSTKKSVFITGANGGMGFETTKILVKQNIERIVMAARTKQKANDAKNKLQNEIQSKSKIEAVGGFDMTKPESIEMAVSSLPKGRKFDVVFLQAGGVFFTDDYQYQKVRNGQIEKTIYQNAIGGYITLLNLKKKGLLSESARIIFAGGEGVRGIPGMIEKPVYNSFQEFENYLFGNGKQTKYNPMNAIGVSKFASAVLVQKLASLNDGLEYIWFSPGLTHGTNGLKSIKNPIKLFFMEKVMFGISGLFGFSQSPKKGAEKYVNALLGKVGVNGEVLGAPEKKVLGKIQTQIPMNSSLSNKELIDGFWNTLQNIYTPYNELEIA